MDSNVKILAVDDDQYLLDLLIETLNAIGYDTVGVSSAKAALDLLKTTDFGLVISDIKMPEMNGIEFVQQIRKDHSQIPVIFISGVFGSSVLNNIHANGFLTKPFRIGQMEELIESITSKAVRPDDPSDPQKILVVDDDDSFRIILTETLKLSGYSVLTASNSREGIALLQNGGISSVIADVKMPGMDGISLAGYIKKTWPDIPVIIITGYYPVAEEEHLFEDVADGFLMKPFKIENITDLMESLNKKK
jgi:DNA-binding NtrC family response regulator